MRQTLGFLLVLLLTLLMSCQRNQEQKHTYYKTIAEALLNNPNNTKPIVVKVTESW